MKKIKDLLKERNNYPVGAKQQNKNQIDYILQRIGESPDVAYLILPSFFLQKGIGDIKEIKELIFESYNLAALIGLGRIWEPDTVLKFNLIVLTKNKINEIYLCEHPEFKICYRRKKASKLGLITDQIFTEEYEKYLDKVEEYLIKNIENSLSGFKIKHSTFTKEKFYIEYYLPKYKELDDKLSKEKTLPLSELVEIIIPKFTKEEGKVLGVGNFKYPIDIDKLPIKRRVKNEISKGDILISRLGNSKSYLVSQNVQKIYPTTSTYILRTNSRKITPEYLFLFLQSDVAQKYILRNSIGSILSKINKRDLNNLPIIIPKKEILSKSKEVFTTLYLKPKENVLVSEINDLLFSKKKTINQPIQEEFVNELFDRIKFTKLTIIKEIVEADFKEIKKCVNQEAFKASIILCGSILEAVLLDWLSEVKKKNYIDSDEDLSFFDMIEEMKKINVFDKKMRGYAHHVRAYRNLVHPKKMLKEKRQLNTEIVKDIIWKLKKILEKRQLR